jgi:hypothetical protein
VHERKSDGFAKRLSRLAQRKRLDQQSHPRRRPPPDCGNVSPRPGAQSGIAFSRKKVGAQAERLTRPDVKRDAPCGNPRFAPEKRLGIITRALFR